MTTGKRFVFPDFDGLMNEDFDYENVVVVSIIGKTSFNDKGLKLKTFRRMFSNSRSADNDLTIEGFFDSDNKVVYLHVHSYLDTDNFVDNYEKIVQQCEEMDGRENPDFLTVFEQIKSSNANAFFLLFYISHLVIVSHPGFTFDTNYIQYFKAMEAMEKSYIEEITSGLKEAGDIGKDWIAAGRPATPRLILYFDKCPKHITNVKKFEHNLEDRIYQVLRKSRVVGANKLVPLFTIPMNEEFVYVSQENNDYRLGDALRGLILGCQPGANLQVQVPFCDRSENSQSLQTFLKRHIKLAQRNGFDYSSGHFELPSLTQWINASKVIYKIVTKPKLVATLCTETRFSEQRCLKVLPLAFAHYQEGLPARYTSTIHQTRLEFALALFAAQARGPMFNKYSEQLVADCTAFWENGKQLCEFLSLKGNPCALPQHHDDDQPHSSGVKYIAVCDCGRKPGFRDDPYNPTDSNYLFYHNLAKECGCANNDRLPFPTDNSSKSPKPPKLPEEPQTQEPFANMLTLSSPQGFLPEYSSWSLVCYGASSLYSHNIGLPDNHQPGFYPNTNYLLPWDVHMYPKNQPTFDEAIQIESKSATSAKKEGKQKWIPQFAVKIFVGFEYECPRGHRFMLAAPDKILKASPGCAVREKGQKVAESEMPLFFPCLCGRGNLSAQLMRLHVVTPKAAVHVKINPRVQPASGAPIFVPSLAGPTTLTQAAYWILRFPCIYYADGKNFVDTQAAKLLSGVFTVARIEHAKEKH